MRNLTRFMNWAARVADARLPVLAVFTAISGLCLAQKMEPARYWEIGDKAAYAWTQHFDYSANVKEDRHEWEVLDVSKSQIRMEERRALRRVERIYDLERGGISKSLCVSVAEICVHNPPYKYGDFPLEPGKRSRIDDFTQGETFQSQRAGECVEEAVEKVKVPAGEFDTFRIACAITTAVKILPGRGRAAASYSVAGKHVAWMALVNGKPIVVRLTMEQAGSPARRIMLELTNVSFK